MARTTTVRKYTAKQANALMNGGSIQKADSIHKYKIEKDIPIPPSATRVKYPLFNMEIGDSFIAPYSERHCLRNALSRAHKSKHGYRFITRTVSGRGRAGKQIRVWRIAK